MEVSTTGDGLCTYNPSFDRESLFAEVMTQIEVAIMQELQDNALEEEPLDYDGELDFDNIDHNNDLVICPLCRYIRAIYSS